MVGWVGREVNTVEAGGREGKRELKVAKEGMRLDLQLKGQQCVHHNVTGTVQISPCVGPGERID